MSETLHIKTAQYATLHNCPQVKWYWVVTDRDGEVVDYQDDFDSEYAARSHGDCVLRNIQEERAPPAPRERPEHGTEEQDDGK